MLVPRREEPRPRKTWGPRAWKREKDKELKPLTQEHSNFFQYDGNLARRQEIEEMIRSVRQELLERIVKEVIDVLVPQVQDAIAKAVKLIQQLRLQQRGVEGLVELPVSQTQDMVIPQEPVTEPISEQIVAASEPQSQEKLVEVIQPIPQARTSARIGDQIADIPVPLVPEGLGEVVEVIPKERLQQRAAEQKAALAWLASKPRRASISLHR